VCPGPLSSRHEPASPTRHPSPPGHARAPGPSHGPTVRPISERAVHAHVLSCHGVRGHSFRAPQPSGLRSFDDGEKSRSSLQRYDLDPTSERINQPQSTQLILGRGRDLPRVEVRIGDLNDDLVLCQGGGHLNALARVGMLDRVLCCSFAMSLTWNAVCAGTSCAASHWSSSALSLASSSGWHTSSATNATAILLRTSRYSHRSPVLRQRNPQRRSPVVSHVHNLCSKMWRRRDA
jgi:hypothetical protein